MYHVAMRGGEVGVESLSGSGPLNETTVQEDRRDVCM